MGIYNKLNGPRWKLNLLTDVIGHAETGTLHWGSCNKCLVHNGYRAPGHGTISLARSELPSYCCWRGVSCCTEQRSSTAGLISTSSSTAEPTCSRITVHELQLWGLGLSGPFARVLPELQILHSYGLRHLDLSKNGLTGPLPQDIGSLVNLTHLLLGSNSECH